MELEQRKQSVKLSVNTLTNEVVVQLLRWWCSSWQIDVVHPAPIVIPSIIAMWHDEMLPVWKYCARFRPVALVSRSKDGEILRSLLHHWGYTVVRGSRSHGGKEALQKLQEYAQRFCILLTPDGSRGPRHRMKPGAVVLAARTHVPLYLCRIKARGIRFRRSWDQFLLPYPFSPITLYFSPPILLPENASAEQISSWITQCEQWMNDSPESVVQCIEQL